MGGKRNAEGMVASDGNLAVQATRTDPSARGVGEIAAKHPVSGKRRRWPKVVGIVLGVVVGLALLAVVGLNVYVRTTYASFYEHASAPFGIPGTNSGFVVQDLDYLDGADLWLFSGYMASDGPSPLMRHAADGSESRVFLAEPDGATYAGHGSGVTSLDDYVYVTCEGGYLVFSADEVAAAQDGDTVTALAKMDLEFTPAFMNIEGDRLLVGNFYRAGNYETPDSHRIMNGDGEVNPAIIYAYPLDAAAPYGISQTADAVLSIPERIQGTCLTDDGRIVLSQSYGIASSHLLAYDTAKLTQDGTFFADGAEVPLFCLDSRSLSDDVVAPPMSEGIESHDGLVYVSGEAASNKYIFGKLYGAGVVYALDMGQ